MPTIEFTLLVEPKSVQHGSRAGLRRGKIHFYNDAEKTAYQTRIILESKHHAPREPLEGPLSLSLTFYLPRPKKMGKNLTPCGVRPDVTNLVKHTEDALTQAGFWKDDKQVIKLSAWKLYADEGTPSRIFVSIATP